MTNFGLTIGEELRNAKSGTVGKPQQVTFQPTVPEETTTTGQIELTISCSSRVKRMWSGVVVSTPRFFKSKTAIGAQVRRSIVVALFYSAPVGTCNE